MRLLQLNRLCSRITGGLLLSLLLLNMPLLNAADELLAFADDNMRERYYALIAELRCPKCQNQNLADSNAPIAEDLRRELHTLLHEGYSDSDILEFMRNRYGEFVLYDPPLNQSTIVLWLLPAVLALTGVLVVFWLVRVRQGDEKPVGHIEGTDAIAQAGDEDIDRRVDELLEKYNDD